MVRIVASSIFNQDLSLGQGLGRRTAVVPSLTWKPAYRHKQIVSVMLIFQDYFQQVATVVPEFTTEVTRFEPGNGNSLGLEGKSASVREISVNVPTDLFL